MGKQRTVGGVMSNMFKGKYTILADKNQILVTEVKQGVLNFAFAECHSEESQVSTEEKLELKERLNNYKNIINDMVNILDSE